MRPRSATRRSKPSAAAIRKSRRKWTWMWQSPAWSSWKPIIWASGIRWRIRLSRSSRRRFPLMSSGLKATGMTWRDWPNTRIPMRTAFLPWSWRERPTPKRKRQAPPSWKPARIWPAPTPFRSDSIGALLWSFISSHSVKNTELRSNMILRTLYLWATALQATFNASTTCFQTSQTSASAARSS